LLNTFINALQKADVKVFFTDWLTDYSANRHIIEPNNNKITNKKLPVTNNMDKMQKLFQLYKYQQTVHRWCKNAYRIPQQIPEIWLVCRDLVTLSAMKLCHSFKKLQFL